MSVNSLTLQLTHLTGDQYRLRLMQEDSESGAMSNPLGSHPVTVSLPPALPANLALDPAGYGRWLGQQLLADPVASQALSSMLAAAEAQDRPLRLILDLPPQLQKLEWETLQLDNAGPLALRERLRLSRLLPTTGQRPVLHTVPDPLRVLTAVAAPADLADYDLHRPDAEQLHELIEAALPLAQHRRGGGSLADIREELTKGADIFCLVAHGKLHQGQPYLLLAEGQDNVTLVEGHELAALIADLSEQPRLAVLISCFGVAAATDDGDAAGALGPLLVEAGIPALLAMRHEFTEESALALLPALLREVAVDGAIDRALAAARWQIRDRHDAWRPVLFAHMKDGLLWDGEPPLPADTPSPYRDLRAFQEEDKNFFFGRESVVDTLLDRIRAQQLLAVIGPSGSGKSSTVLAGLLPAVREKTDWRVATMRPGIDPIGALVAAFIGQSDPDLPLEVRLPRQKALAEQLLNKETTVAELVGELMRDRPDSQLLLVVDQFEELFSQSQAANEFVQLLITPLNRQLPLKVVLTMRADFMAAALATPGLAAALDEHIYPLGPMNREELSQAITRPAQNVGARFEPGLVSYILDDVGEKTGNLPLLQFTLSRLWEHRDGRMLTFAQYEALGKVDGALRGHADRVLAGFEGADEKATVRRLLVQLIQPGLGASDTRRVAPKGQFTAPEQALIDELADQRLLVTDQNDRGEDTVEIAHEALIESWGTLRQWMNADREFRAWQERLRVELNDWQERQDQPKEKREAFLLPPGRLAAAEEWLANREADIRPDEKGFILASHAHQEQIEAAAEAQRQRELELEAQARQEAEARASEQTAAAARLRRRLYFAVGAVILALLAAVAALVANNNATRSEERAEENLVTATEALIAGATANAKAQENLATATSALIDAATSQAVAENNLATATAALNAAATSEAAAQTQAAIAAENAATAQQNAQIALSRQLATQSQQLLADWQYEIGLLLAIQAGKESDTREAFAVIRRAIVQPGRSRHILQHDGAVNQASWNGDGSLLLTVTGGTARVWDTATGLERFALQHGSDVTQASWNSDESLILTRSGTTARIWDTATRQERFALQHDDVVYWASWNSDESLILTASADDTARVWDAATGQERFALQHDDDVYRASWNSDESLILTRSGTTARVWDTATGQERFALQHDGFFQSSWSADGSLILTASSNGTTRVWDAATGEERFTLQHDDWVWQASWNRNESLVLTASQDNTARVWDAATGQERFTLQHEDWVNRANWNADGSLILTASVDGTARVWDAATGQERFTLQHDSFVFRANWNSDETLILTRSGTTARVWDAVTGQERFVLQHGSDVTQASWNRDESLILTYGGTTARVWDAVTGQERFVLQHDDDVTQASWNRDESLILTYGGTTARVWDTVTGQERFVLQHDDDVTQASWNRDESLILTYGGAAARVWDAVTGQERFTLRHRALIFLTSWNADGSLILTAGSDGTTRVWDTASGEERFTLPYAKWVMQASWNADGSLILTASNDGTARVWDAATGQQRFALQHGSDVPQASWNADESLILTYGGATARVWDAVTGRIWDAATGLGRFAFQHDGDINQGSLNADGNLILTASDDGTARVWDATGQQRFALQHGSQVTQASWNADESLILTASNDGTARVWGRGHRSGALRPSA